MKLESWLWLTGITGLHLLLLAAASMYLGRRDEPVTPPTVIGMLVAAPLPVEPPKPLPAVPEPAPPPPVVRPKPIVKPPLPKAPPSERAVTAPPPEPPAPPVTEKLAEAAPPAAPPAPPAPPTEAPPPVVPPRTDASHLNNPAPVYPNVSRRLGEQGRVLFDVYILPDGSVGEIKLKQSSGFERLDLAALDAVKRWRYVPARRGDTPIPYWYVQPIAFAIDS